MKGGGHEELRRSAAGLLNERKRRQLRRLRGEKTEFKSHRLRILSAFLALKFFSSTEASELKCFATKYIGEEEQESLCPCRHTWDTNL